MVSFYCYGDSKIKIIIRAAETNNQICGCPAECICEILEQAICSCRKVRQGFCESCKQLNPQY